MTAPSQRVSGPRWALVLRERLRPRGLDRLSLPIVVVLWACAFLPVLGCGSGKTRSQPQQARRNVPDRFADVERGARGIPGIHSPGLRSIPPVGVDAGSASAMEPYNALALEPVNGDPEGETAGARPGPGGILGSRGTRRNVRGPKRGKVVAVFELANPSRDRFILHGTLPIPPDAVTFHRGRTPLAVRSLGTTGELVPAQVEVVVRDSLGRPEVLEISAPVQRAGPPGKRTRYEVVRVDMVLPPPGALSEAAAAHA